MKFLRVDRLRTGCQRAGKSCGDPHMSVAKPDARARAHTLTQREVRSAYIPLASLLR
jgi:hypothetical protein